MKTENLKKLNFDELLFEHKNKLQLMGLCFPSIFHSSFLNNLLQDEWMRLINVFTEKMDFRGRSRMRGEKGNAKWVWYTFGTTIRKNKEWKETKNYLSKKKRQEWEKRTCQRHMVWAVLPFCIKKKESYGKRLMMYWLFDEENSESGSGFTRPLPYKYITLRELRILQ